MKAGVGLKSTANAKSPRKQLKCHCFSQPAQIPDNVFFISPSLFSHLFSDDILSSLFSSLTLFQRDLAIDTPQAWLCWSDVCVSSGTAPPPHFYFIQVLS